jgi:hypothetical protein
MNGIAERNRCLCALKLRSEVGHIGSYSLINRRRLSSMRSAALGGCLLLLSVLPVFAASRQAVERTSRDFVFFLLSDVHVGAEDLKATPRVTAAESLARLSTNLDTMRGLVGQPYPSRPDPGGKVAGRISDPFALVILGDLTDGHKEPARQEEQWRSFEGLFPVNGVVFGNSTVPGICLAGNHDGELDGPARRGLIARNRALLEQGRLTAVSSNSVHFAFNRDGVHFLGLGLCAADTTDAETPFKYGKPGPGSWNDPQGAFSFLREYLERVVGKSGEPVVLMQHYGFDGFSMNDWNWWTPKQRRALYELLDGYNIAAILHGHNHHAEHYRWPDPKLHQSDLQFYFDGKPHAKYRQYEILSCGNVCWVVRVSGNRLIAAHYDPTGWATATERYFAKDLKP